MKRPFISLSFLFYCILLVSCSESSDSQWDIEDLEIKDDILLTKSILRAEQSEDYCVSLDMVEAYLASEKDSARNIVSIDLFPCSDNPAFYVVNFENGWKVFPTDSRFGVCLAESPEGQLDLNEESDNVGFNLWFESLMERIQFAHTGIVREYDENSVTFWNVFRSSLNSRKFLEDIFPDTKSNPPYWYSDMWVVAERGLVTVDTIIGGQWHLMNTKWGQGDPWNVKMPIVADQYCLTGCPAVAVSQILYYYHYKNDQPSGLYHSLIKTGLTYNSTYNRYSVSLNKSDYTYDSPRWDQMPLTNTGGTNAQYGYVSDLMLDVGERLGTLYNVGSSGIVADSQNYYSLFPVDIGYAWSQFTPTWPDIVVNNLSTKDPVILSATKSSNNAKHTWVVDGYVQTSYSVYQSCELWPTDLVPEDVTGICGIYSETQMEEVFPGYYPGMQFLSSPPINTYTNTKLYMNWGYDGQHYYDAYSCTLPLSWDGYDINMAIHYNLYPYELNLWDNNGQ